MRTLNSIPNVLFLFRLVISSAFLSLVYLLPFFLLRPCLRPALFFSSSRVFHYYLCLLYYCFFRVFGVMFTLLVHGHIYTHTYIHTHTYTCAHNTHIHTYIHARARLCVHTHAHTLQSASEVTGWELKSRDSAADCKHVHRIWVSAPSFCIVMSTGCYFCGKKGSRIVKLTPPLSMSEV